MERSHFITAETHDAMAARLHTQGQRHDRIFEGGTSNDNTSPHMPAMRTAGNSSDSETTLSQKLMSAVVGSVLTSLVGESVLILVDGTVLTMT